MQERANPTAATPSWCQAALSLFPQSAITVLIIVFAHKEELFSISFQDNHIKS